MLLCRPLIESRFQEKLLQFGTHQDLGNTYMEMGLIVEVLCINRKDYSENPEKSLEQERPASHHPPRYNFLQDPQPSYNHLFQN